MKAIFNTLCIAFYLQKLMQGIFEFTWNVDSSIPKTEFQF